MSDRVTVKSAAGTVVGLTDGVDARFLGIPFAEAPLGERRFAPPVARAPFSAPFDASRYGSTPQRGEPYAFTTIPEPSIPGDDTLTLNVFAPYGLDTAAGGLLDRRGGSSSEPELAPVLVWIHGGGYLAGSAASPWYDGAAFTRDGIVVVSVSYRLGVDGFAAIDGEANRGVRDWMLALAWVRDNIAAFGGDPERVTIAGQSAGGGAVLTLLSTPAAQQLFARAIALSPVDVSSALTDAARFTGMLATQLGVAPSAAGLASVDRDSLQYAAVHWSESHPGDGLLSLGPVHGDELLPLAIRDALGVTGTDKPLLIGSTADEFDSPGFPGVDGAEAAAPTVDAAPDSPRQTDTLFRATVPRTARSRASGTGGTWLYSFDWASPVLRGAAHCTDLPFFFDILGAEGVARVLGHEAPAGLAAAAHATMIDFVRGTDPAWNPGLGVAGDEVLRLTDRAMIAQGAYDDVLPLLDAHLEE